MMSFQILEILGSQPEGISVKVSHQANQITALITNPVSSETLVGKLIDVEISFDKVLDWKVIGDFDDTKSGIWQEPDGIHLLGRVHNILDYGDGKIIIDVYMQNGPEFFTVSSEAIDNTAVEGSSGLEITVGNLYLSER